MSHIAMVALLALLLPGPAWAQVIAQPNTELPDGAVDAQVERDMVVGRYYVGRGDYSGAIARFKQVVRYCRSSRQIDEALAGLAKAYLAFGINWEAQTAAAVLARKYPHSRWTAMAADDVKSAGLDPLEDSRSWIGQICK